LVADDTYPEHPWKIRVDNVQLDVQTRAQDGTVWIYQVNGATHVFYFREAAGEQASDGRAKWYCTRWEDSPIGLARPDGPHNNGLEPYVERTTWGRIKGAFR
jgi:hypothetical protein